jgi:hypothetical protein
MPPTGQVQGPLLLPLVGVGCRGLGTGLDGEGAEGGEVERERRA